MVIVFDIWVEHAVHTDGNPDMDIWSSITVAANAGNKVEGAMRDRRISRKRKEMCSAHVRVTPIKLLVNLWRLPCNTETTRRGAAYEITG